MEIIHIHIPIKCAVHSHCQGNPTPVHVSSDDVRQAVRQSVSKYPKSKRNVIDERFHPRSTKKVRWTLVDKQKRARINFLFIDQSSSDQVDFFGGRLYFSPQGVLRPEIYTRARDSQALIAHTRSGTGVPPPKKKIISGENLKFALKFSVLATITSGLVGVSPQNIFHVPRDKGHNMGITFGRPTP